MAFRAYQFLNIPDEPTPLVENENSSRISAEPTDLFDPLRLCTSF